MTNERWWRNSTIAFVAAAMVGSVLVFFSTSNNSEPSFLRNNNIMETQRSSRWLYWLDGSLAEIYTNQRSRDTLDQFVALKKIGGSSWNPPS